MELLEVTEGYALGRIRLAKQYENIYGGMHGGCAYSVSYTHLEMLSKINQLGIGPGGLGGTTTALAVNINTCLLYTSRCV